MDQSPAEQPSRPYRSKRRRPCDVCRRRKQSCRLNNSGPCSTCRTLGTECTFLQPPTKKRRGVQLPETFVADEPDRGPYQSPPQQADLDWTLDGSPASAFQMFAQDFDSFGQLQQLPSSTLFPSHYGAWRIPFTADELFTPEDSQHLPQDEREINPITNGGNQSNSASSAAVYQKQDVVANGADTQQRGSGTAMSLSSQGHSLDDPEVSISQYLGLSGDMDPYMLQHMRFPDNETQKIFKSNYRRVFPGSRSSFSEGDLKVPVHFIQNPREVDVSTNRVSERPTTQEESTRGKLEDLVLPEIGARLVGLFFRYIFPSLPVLSRTCMGLRSETLIPTLSAQRTLPPYLLAAVYALAVPFCRYDPVLCVSHIFDKPPAADLWTVAQEGVLQESQKPRLSTLQTALLCLQRPSDRSDTFEDSSSRRSLLSLIVSFSSKFGLHLDCISWSIPAWEKRLRRRLWWIIYSEATWSSLLAGYPHPISDDDWVVTPLTNSDFAIDNIFCPSEETNRKPPADQEPCLFCHNGYDFKFLATLTVIANNVFKTFFTLRATQKIGSDISASLEAAQRLIQQLELWHADLPLHLRTDSTRQSSALQSSFHSASGAHLRLSYLTLGILIYRAVFRTFVPSSCGPSITSASNSFMSSSSPNVSFISEVKAATSDWLEKVILYTETLTARDQSSFWFACLSAVHQHLLTLLMSTGSQTCFATISSFILFRLLQSNDRTEARRVMSLTRRWAGILRDQTVAFEQMRFGLLRLDTVFSSGFENIFHCEKFLVEALWENVKNSGPQPT